MKPLARRRLRRDHDLGALAGPATPLRSVHWKLSSKVDDLVGAGDPGAASDRHSAHLRPLRPGPRSWTGPSTGWTVSRGSLKPSGATMSSGFSRAPSKKFAPPVSPTSRSCARLQWEMFLHPRAHGGEAPRGRGGPHRRRWTGPSPPT